MMVGDAAVFVDRRRRGKAVAGPEWIGASYRIPSASRHAYDTPHPASSVGHPFAEFTLSPFAALRAVRNGRANGFRAGSLPRREELR
jgi:hypothetical protein